MEENQKSEMVVEKNKVNVRRGGKKCYEIPTDTNNIMPKTWWRFQSSTRHCAVALLT